MKYYELKLTLVVRLDDTANIDTASEALLQTLRASQVGHVGHARVDATREMGPMHVNAIEMPHDPEELQ